MGLRRVWRVYGKRELADELTADFIVSNRSIKVMNVQLEDSSR
jgi:hypothetical protein